MNPMLKYIGKVSSELKDIEDCPRQADENAPEATIIIYSEFADGVRNIKPGDEILLFTWLHMGDRSVLETAPGTIPMHRLQVYFRPGRPIDLTLLASAQ